MQTEEIDAAPVVAVSGEPWSLATPSANRLLYISWAQSCSRSDHTARELGGVSHMVYLSWLGSHGATIALKYLGQFLMTAWLLVRHRPAAVVVMSPPLFAAFAPLIYHYLTGRPFALDCHTAAFTHPRWKRLQWLQHALERRAAVNIVHNEYLRDLVEQHRGRAVIVSDVPVVYLDDEPYELSSSFNVTAVCSFNPDEPIQEIIEAARRLPDVQFYLTGNPKFLAEESARSLPANARLTGFLSDAAYGHLIRHSDVVMSLTTRDHTMLRGAWEAIYQGTPVIVSDWSTLRQAFPEGAVHVDNSAASIAAAIQSCRENRAALRAGAAAARQGRLRRWGETRTVLIGALFGRPHGESPADKA